jgi:hypothetical protein
LGGELYDQVTMNHRRIPVTIRPPFGVRAKVATPFSTSLVFRALTGLTCTPTDGARAWIALNWAIPEALL